MINFEEDKNISWQLIYKAETEIKINEEIRKSQLVNQVISINSVPETVVSYRKKFDEIKFKAKQDIKTRFQEIAESKFNFKHKLTKFERMNLESSFDARILLYGKNKPRKIHKVKRKFMSSMTLNQNQIKRGSTRRGSKHTEISDLDDKSSFDTVYVPDPDEEMNFNFGSLEKASKRLDIIRNTRRKSCVCSFCGNYKLRKGDRIILDNEKVGYMFEDVSSQSDSEKAEIKHISKGRNSMQNFADRKNSFASTIRNFKNVMSAIQFMRRKRRTRYGFMQDIDKIDENDEIYMPMNQLDSIFYNTQIDSDK